MIALVPGGVDDMNVAQDGGGSGDDVKVRILDLAACRFPVLQHVDLRRRRRHPFLGHAGADQSVDECALAGIEFTDDDQEEEFVELLDGTVQRRLMLG